MFWPHIVFFFSFNHCKSNSFPPYHPSFSFIPYCCFHVLIWTHSVMFFTFFSLSSTFFRSFHDFSFPWLLPWLLPSSFLLGGPVIALFALWHHPVPSAARLRNSRGAGCLGHPLFFGLETSLDSKPRPLSSASPSVNGFGHYSDSAPCLADLGCDWLQSGSRSLPCSALHGL